MKKKSILTIIGLCLIVILAACSSLSIPGLTSQTSSTSLPTTDTSSAAIENKLGVGILRLEGSDLAITAEQAVELLPVWKAVRVMTADKSASSLEIAALYQQTLGTLTAEQIQAIQEMSWTQAELNTLMQDLGVQANQEANTFNSTVKSSLASMSSSAAGGGPGGDFGGPGGFGGPDQLGSQINAVTSSQSQTTTSSSANASTKSSSASAAPSSTASQVSLNTLFADSIVSLLQQRAGL